MNVRNGIEYLPLYLFLCRLDWLFRHIDSWSVPCRLLSYRATRALAGPRIRLSALTANRQAAAMSDAAISTQIHQSFDIHRNFAAQVALDGKTGDCVA
jgi:hypothetical protein